MKRCHGIHDKLSLVLICCIWQNYLQIMKKTPATVNHCFVQVHLNEKSTMADATLDQSTCAKLFATTQLTWGTDESSGESTHVSSGGGIGDSVKWDRC